MTEAVVTSSWETGIARIRATSNWIGVTLGAIGVAVFGGGPLVQRFSGSLDNVNLRFVAAGFVLGIGGLLWVVFVLAEVQTPLLVNLVHHPKLPLPAEFNTVGALQAEKRLAEVAVTGIEKNIVACQAALDEAERTLHRAEERVGDPAAEDDIPELRGNVSKARSTLVVWKQGLVEAQSTVTRFEKIETELLDALAFIRVSEVFNERKLYVAMGAVAAAVGSLLYLIGLGPKEEAPAPKGPTLVRIAPVKDSKLLEQLGVPATCAFAWRVIGDGTEASPNKLIVDRGAGGPTCPATALSFSATRTDITVSEIRPLTPKFVVDQATLIAAQKTAKQAKSDRNWIMVAAGVFGVVVLGTAGAIRRFPKRSNS